MLVFHANLLLLRLHSATCRQPCCKSKVYRNLRKMNWKNVKDVIKPFAPNLIVFLSILCLITIFWIPLNNFITIVFVEPIFCHVTKNSLLVQFAMLGLEAIYYIVIWRQLMKEKWKSVRRIVIFEILFIYLLFRVFGEYDFYGTEEGSLGYVDFVGVVSLVIEWTFIFRYFIVCNKKTVSPTEVSAFFIDKPTNKDELRRQFHADVLIEKIRSTFPELSIKERIKMENETSAFTVLLSERFGQGKSSFFMQIKYVCEKKGIDIVEFRPWLSNDSNHMIVDFFNLLREKIGFYDKELKRLLQTYAVLSAEYITGKVANVATTHFNTISIETQHDRITKLLQAEGKLRLVLIDDVDRLQAEELLALIKLIRNSADFPYIAYIVAADKEAVKETLRSASIKNPELYLKKFFNFELLFPADDDNVLGKLVDKITETLLGFGYTIQDLNEIKSGINKQSHYYSPVFPNIRDVYRFCNILSFELDLLRGLKNSDGVNTPMLKDIYIADLVKICMIQFVSPDLYKILRDFRFVLLEDYRHGKLVLRDVGKEYVETSDRARYIREVITKAGGTMRKIDFEGTSQLNEGNTDKTKSELKTHIDLLANISPDEEELIKYLIDDLWGKTDSYADLRKSCYRSQYFLYFSGRYRKDELSDEEALELFTKSDIDFANCAKNLIVTKKESMIHKLNTIVEERKLDRLLLLDKIMSLSYIDYQDYQQRNRSPLMSYDEYYNTQQYTNILKNLYLLHGKEVLDRDQVFKTHKSFFNSTKEYASSALALVAMKPSYSDVQERIISLFPVDKYDALSKLLLDRFCNEVLSVDPFGEKSIEAIPCMRAVNAEYWNMLFKNYLKNTDNPIEWIFHLFKLKHDEEGMYWNRQFVLAVFGENPRFHFIDTLKNLFGEEFVKLYELEIPEFESHLISTNSIFIDMINGNRLFKEAYEWLQKR